MSTVNNTELCGRAAIVECFCGLYHCQRRIYSHHMAYCGGIGGGEFPIATSDVKDSVGGLEVDALNESI